MRSLRLARVAAEAERLRIRRIVRRLAIRAIFGAVAGIFALAGLAWLHMLIWFALAHSLHPILRSVVMIAIDVVVMLILALLAMRSPADPVEAEALAVRRQAVAQLRRSLSMAALAGTMARALGRNRGIGMALGALASRLFNRP